MRPFQAIVATLLLTGIAAGQEQVTFPTGDGGLIHADLYGKGGRGVVLAHGGRFNKESWKKQAEAMEKAGFRVLAFNFRGYGESRGPGQADPLKPRFPSTCSPPYVTCERREQRPSRSSAAAWRGAAGAASVAAEPREVDRLVFLGSEGSSKDPEKMKGRKLFIVARDDLGPSDIPRLPKIRENYEKTRGPKELIIVEGSAHAQFLFDTDQGPRR